MQVICLCIFALLNTRQEYCFLVIVVRNYGISAFVIISPNRWDKLPNSRLNQKRPGCNFLSCRINNGKSISVIILVLPYDAESACIIIGRSPANVLIFQNQEVLAGNIVGVAGI